MKKAAETTLTTGRGNSSAGRAGFTLLELILVMVVISVALAVAAPSLRGFGEARRTPDAAAQLLALLRHARDCARVEGVAYDFHLDPQQRQYWLTRRVCGADEAPDGGLGKRFTLPEGISVEFDAAGEAGVDTLRLHPTGRAAEATITVTGPDGTSARIVCRSATERFQVADEKGDGS